MYNPITLLLYVACVDMCVSYEYSFARLPHCEPQAQNAPARQRYKLQVLRINNQYIYIYVSISDRRYIVGTKSRFNRPPDSSLTMFLLSIARCTAVIKRSTRKAMETTTFKSGGGGRVRLGWQLAPAVGVFHKIIVYANGV